MGKKEEGKGEEKGGGEGLGPRKYFGLEPPLT